MKFIYVIKEYIKVAFKCLKYSYKMDKKGTVVRLGILILFPVLNNIINIVNARLADSMQKSFGTGIIQYVLPAFGFLIAFTVLNQLFDFLNRKLSMVWGRKLNQQVFIDQLDQKRNFTIPFIDSSDYEELRQRIEVSGTGRYAQVMLTKSIPEFLSILINIIFTAYIAYSYNGLFATLIIISSLPSFYFLFMKIFAVRKNYESNLEKNKYIGIYSGMFLSYQTLKDIKSSNNGDKFIDTYRTEWTKLLDSNLLIHNKYLNISFFTSLLTTIVIFLVQYYVIKDVVFGSILIGQATLIIVQVSRLEGNITNLSSFLPDQYENVVTSKYLFLQAETKENTDKVVGEKFSVANDLLEFKDLDFKYEDTRSEEMHKLNDEIDHIATKYFGLKKTEIVKKEKEASNFNLHIDHLTIHKGEKIAVVGKNGNGKTTFIQLLLNIYQPQSGDIILYGNNLRDISQEDITNNFSVLFQDYSQAPLKVSEYIGLSEKGHIDMNKVKQVTELATADEFIEKWNHGYEEYLGVWMKGVKPSKGQWQKLALARTLYKDSPIIILDEPTASIDAISSKKIFENLKKVDSGKTIILISHNMTDIADFADRIIVFDKGRIVGDGTHEELLTSSPIYKDLYESESR